MHSTFYRKNPYRLLGVFLLPATGKHPYFVVQPLKQIQSVLIMKNLFPARRFFPLLFSICLHTGLMAQTPLGSTANPANGGSLAAGSVTVPPVAGLIAGDLVVIFAHCRSTAPTLSITTTGGQTWNATAITASGSNQRYAVFWCRFNGTWAANPVVTASSGTNPITGAMYAYRPTNPNKKWAIHAGPAASTSNANPHSITGLTTTLPNTVTMAFWTSANNSTWGTLGGAGWSKAGISAEYRNLSGSTQTHSAAYCILTAPGAVSNVQQNQTPATNTLRTRITWYELNDECTSATVLTQGATCTNLKGTLENATASSPAVPSGCGTPGGDVWYQFTATTAFPVISLSGMGGSMNDNPSIQLFEGTCGGFIDRGCVTATEQNTLSLNTAYTVGGAGLTIGTTYYIRIYSNTASPTGSGTAWQYNICITDAAVPGLFDFGKSYINISKGTAGGTINVGDTLEIRATFVLRDPTWSGLRGAADSLAFYDTLLNNKGYRLLPGATAALALKTNEGQDYKVFTTAADADAAAAIQIPSTLDTAIRINFGMNATDSKRGMLRNTSKPSVFGVSCIIMATYRVEVYAAIGTKINWGGGAISYRDTATGLLSAYNFKRDSLIVSDTLRVCPDAVSAVNVIGVEANGTFGAPVNPAPLNRNKGTSAYVPGYIYNPFARGTGPGDYYYGIANNTSSEFSTNASLNKPDPDPDAGGPMSTYRLFAVWDITGDHTGAADPYKGNLPCDTTQPVSATNPCGYMLVVNSSYKTDTAFQYSATGLCPNTYYEVSAWVKNICSRCSCDSNGVTPSTVGYIPSGPSDSSGVKPNLAFEINGIDYYTTGNIEHNGARSGITPEQSDTANRWVKKGFVYKTGAAETSFTLTIRNNAPGGGGNDWALDDISIATCLPRMSYSPTNNPAVCEDNVITIYDTVSSYFNNYTNYKWQISTNGGSTWVDIGGASGTATPVWNGSAYSYVVSYTVPATMTTAANDGNLYRVVVGTTATNLADANCQFSDPTNITLDVMTDCGPVLKTDLLSVSGTLRNQYATINWISSREEGLVSYLVERSADGRSFSVIDTVAGNRQPHLETNTYAFTDPDAVSNKVYYRIGVLNGTRSLKYSRVIQLNTGNIIFGWGTVVNPFRNELQFDVLSPENGEARIELLDASAKVIRTVSRPLYNGTNSITIDHTGTMPAGMYILRVSFKGNTLIRKVLKNQL